MLSRLPTAARHHLAALVAVVALLGQTLFPHVHVWQPKGQAGGATHQVGLAACRAECPTVLAAASAAGDADHDADRHATGCPLCRAQNDARSSLLPPSTSVPLPTTVDAHVTIEPVASTADAVRALAAPRAPPFAS